MNKILLVDGNSILNRAFYGLPDLTTKEGLHTNAVLGFLNIIFKVIDEEKATHICVAFDVKHPTFRHDMYKEYKGTRKSMPDELREQVPLIKEVLASMNIFTIERPGYEADDILGTLSRNADKAGYLVSVLSGDRDLLQLATDKILIRLPKTKAGKTIIESYYADNVKETYGVDPITFIDMKGLMGDTSDNIPGVPGIGEKTAAKLLTEYGSLEGVYDNLDTMKKSKMKDNLQEFKEQAFMSRELATIKLDCELEADLEDMLIEDMFNSISYDLFVKLEFKSYMNKFSDDAKGKAFEISYELVEEFDDYTSLIKKVKNASRVGFSIVSTNCEPQYVSICISTDLVYIVKLINFLTIDMVSRDLQEVSGKLCCLDVKSQLPFITLGEESDVFDCGVGAYLINPMKDDYSYEHIANDYLGINLPDYKGLLGKEEITIMSSMNDNHCKYMAYLAVVSYMAYDKICEELKNKNMFDLYSDIELPCVYSLYDMEKNGIKVDKDALLQYGDNLKTRIEELTASIYSHAGEEFNINSTKKLGEILFEKLGLKSGKKTKTGYSTSVEVLEKLSKEHPVINDILEYRQLTKLNSTYVEGLSGYVKNDGRIHGKFNQTVTATGRISSTEPNLQNIPTRLPLGREIRKVFKPEEGYVFLDADYSQIELRVLAHLSGDSTLIEAYNKDSDIHAITASEVFDVPLDDVDDLMRRKAKAVNFGIVYGISSFGLGQDLDISRKEAEGYIEKYFSTYGNVKLFLDSTVKEAKEKGYTVTMFGRRRPIPELSSSNFMTRSFGERAAMNSPIQGTAADIIKIAMINVNKALKTGNYKSRLVLQVHDELLIEAKIEELDDVKQLLVTKMMEAANLKVPLIVDVHSGDSWYDAK
ncbi:MAG: DNA polymerase I [Lachnospiraceae bacterium]|nr:DNA polymerase I [Lachnospiraceae bacterium]